MLQSLLTAATARYLEPLKNLEIDFANSMISLLCEKKVVLNGLDYICIISTGSEK